MKSVKINTFNGIKNDSGVLQEICMIGLLVLQLTYFAYIAYLNPSLTIGV